MKNKIYIGDIVEILNVPDQQLYSIPPSVNKSHYTGQRYRVFRAHYDMIDLIGTSITMKSSSVILWRRPLKNKVKAFSDTLMNLFYLIRSKYWGVKYLIKKHIKAILS